VRWAAIGLVLLAACHRSPRGGRAQPSMTAAQHLPDAAAAAPAPELTGRWACLVDKHVFATHAMNVYRETTRASFVVTLAPDGSAHGGRGVRSRSSNDGPEVHVNHERREQQGYRGSWRALAGGGLEIALEVDDAVVPALRAYSNLAPQRWLLRCTRAEHGGVALECVVENAVHKYEESYGLVVPKLASERRLVLGAGNGLAIAWEVDSVDGDADDSALVKLAPAASPIEVTDWERP